MRSFLKKIFNAESVHNYITNELICRYLPKGHITMLEAGANDGRDTVKWSRLLQGGRIHAFEPSPEGFEKLQAAVAECDNVSVYPLALGDKEGTATFYISSNNYGASSSLLSPGEHLSVHPEITFDNKVEVTVTTIDSWAEKNGISKIDFMWLDMQGIEMQVLKSSPDILGTVSVINTEVSLIETYKGVTLYPEYRKWLEGQGFKVVAEELKYKDMGNALFVRR